MLTLLVEDTDMTIDYGNDRDGHPVRIITLASGDVRVIVTVDEERCAQVAADLARRRQEVTA